MKTVYCTVYPVHPMCHVANSTSPDKGIRVSALLLGIDLLMLV